MKANYYSRYVAYAPHVVLPCVVLLLSHVFIKEPSFWISNPDTALPKFSVLHPNQYLSRDFVTIQYNDIAGLETVLPVVGLVSSSENVVGYTGDHEGWLVQLLSDGKHERLLHLGGRPLGLAMDNSRSGLYVCVPPVGLLHVSLDNFTVTIVTTISDDGVPIRFADDVDVADDGRVYFSDATQVVPTADKNGHYDIVYASKIDSSMGSGSGRLLVYDPTTKRTRTLISGLRFANGVALSSQQDYVTVTETYGE